MSKKWADFKYLWSEVSGSQVWLMDCATRSKVIYSWCLKPFKTIYQWVMYILTEHKMTWEKGECNWIRDYSLVVTLEPKQIKDTITTWWLGIQSSHPEKLKSDWFIICSMQAGTVNSLLNSLNNGLNSSASFGRYLYNFGKCFFSWKGLSHRWDVSMSSGGPARFSQPLQSTSLSRPVAVTIESVIWIG